MGMGKESPVISVWDNDKLVGLFIDSPTASSRQPDRFDEEIVRIFEEHQEFQERINELELLMQRAYDYIPKGSSLQKEFEIVLKGK